MTAMRTWWLRLRGTQTAFPVVQESARPREEPRTVVINERELNPQELEALDALMAPRVLAGGHYWFDAQTGCLGWVGSPTQYLNLLKNEAPDAPGGAVPIARLRLCRTAGLL